MDQPIELLHGVSLTYNIYCLKKKYSYANKFMIQPLIEGTNIT